MKLIIDIPDEYYKFFQNLQYYSSGRRSGRTIEQSVINAIINSVPYEPKGDLISRSRLRMNFIQAVEDENPKLYGEIILDLIDNAPTVEPCYQTTSCLDCKNYNKETHNCPRYCEVIKEAIKSRPKGEWIDRMSDKGYVECPFCHKQITGGDLNFCVKCGADMRGEEE